MSLEDDIIQDNLPRVKHPENEENICELIHEGCCKIIYELCDIVGIGYDTCQEILTEHLDICHVAAKCVLRLMSCDQKQHHVNVWCELYDMPNNDSNFICTVIIRDESWFYCCDLKTKQHSSQWKSPYSQIGKKHGGSEAKQNACFDIKGIVLRQYVPAGVTVKHSDLYCDVLKQLKENVWRKDQNCGNNRIGYCTMTMHLCTPTSK